MYAVEASAFTTSEARLTAVIAVTACATFVCLIANRRTVLRDCQCVAFAIALSSFFLSSAEAHLKRRMVRVVTSSWASLRSSSAFWIKAARWASSSATGAPMRSLNSSASEFRSACFLWAASSRLRCWMPDLVLIAESLSASESSILIDEEPVSLIRSFLS